MNCLVIDASVAVKWYDTEPGKEAALDILMRAEYGLALYAPPLIVAEIANILWKKNRVGQLGSEAASEIMEAFLNSGVRFHSTDELVLKGLKIAMNTGRTAYDSLYLALAVELGCKVVTADKRLVNGLTGTPWADLVVELDRYAAAG